MQSHFTMKAVRVLAENEWKLDHQKLSEIFLHEDVIDCPVAIYSINGSTRSGKSFLLNLILHHVQKKRQWKESPLESVFDWRSGTSSCTSGILITEKPIFIESFDYGKVAVFFMDAEGFHDVKRNNNDYNHKIFALCSAIGKLQMFNVEELIPDNCLDEITTFRTLFEKEARNASLKSQQAAFLGEVCLFSLNSSGPPLSLTYCLPKVIFSNPLDLLFLVRDFDDVSFGRGIDGGEQYLSKRMKRYSHCSLTVWKGNTKCFLFSYPGKAIDNGSKCDVIKDTDPEFLEEVENLNHFLFQQNFDPIVVDGQPVKGKDMPNLLMDVDNCLCQNEQSLVTGLQSMMKKLQEEFAEECVDIYNKFMSDCKVQVDENGEQNGDSKLKQLSIYHKRAEEEALKHITAKWSYQSSQEDCKAKVVQELERCYQEKEDVVVAEFRNSAVKEWREKMKSIKFTCDDVRKEYKTFGFEVLLKLHQLVVNDVTRSNAIVHFKRDFKDACNEELDRLYDNKKILKIVGSALGGAILVAPLVAIPPLAGAAAAAAAPTAVLMAGGAGALGAGGGGIAAGGAHVITTKFDERIYVEELDEAMNEKSDATDSSDKMHEE